jgi:hypothetical protein
MAASRRPMSISQPFCVKYCQSGSDEDSEDESSGGNEGEASQSNDEDSSDIEED